MDEQVIHNSATNLLHIFDEPVRVRKDILFETTGFVELVCPNFSCYLNEDELHILKKTFFKYKKGNEVV
eukprot:snap_masked-scaffold_3-processed-gene-10.29-mRNA-1 protein AED:1.00 eAED:1.00 QI:0/0/0/0/1/1/2/0/68